MKSLILTVLLIGLVIVFLFYRSRLKLALLVAGGSYIVLTLVRFIVVREEVDRFADLGLVLVAMGAVYLLTDLLTRAVQRHRERRLRR